MDKVKQFFKDLTTKEFWLKAYRSLIWLMLLLFIIDIITKWVVQANLEPGQKVKLFGDSDFLCITLSYNMGASFGMLSNGEIAARILWISISVIMSGVLTFIYIKQFKKLSKAYRVALALMIAGAYGNMIDRVFYWKAIVGFDGVIDWISFSFFPPIFNIADSALVIGAIILVILFIIEMVKEGIAKGKRGEYRYSPKEIDKMMKEEEEKKEEKPAETPSNEKSSEEQDAQ